MELRLPLFVQHLQLATTTMAIMVTKVMKIHAQPQLSVRQHHQMQPTGKLSLVVSFLAILSVVRATTITMQMMERRVQVVVEIIIRVVMAMVIKMIKI